MRLYIIRHGDPDYANDSLTPEGHLEAEALAERMSSHGLDRIYCSPLGRAIQTMKYTADSLGMGYSIEEWTREIPDLRLKESPWGDIAIWDTPGESIRGEKSMPTHFNWHEHSILRTTRAKEKFEELRQNSDDFLQRHGFVREGGRYRCVRLNREKIAVFCHHGFGTSWLAHLLEIPLSLMWSGFWLPTTSVTTILFDERSENWAVPRCIGLGDVSHLYKAGLPVNPRGISANYY